MVEIPLKTQIFKIGNKLSFNSSKNAIIIGEGISKVLVTARINIYNAPGNIQVNLRICKNGNFDESKYDECVEVLSGLNDFSVSNMPMEVEEGDEITLRLLASDAGNYVLLNSCTCLIVQEL